MSVTFFTSNKGKDKAVHEGFSFICDRVSIYNFYNYNVFIIENNRKQLTFGYDFVKGTFQYISIWFIFVLGLNVYAKL